MAVRKPLCLCCSHPHPSLVLVSGYYTVCYWYGGSGITMPSWRTMGQFPVYPLPSTSPQPSPSPPTDPGDDFLAGTRAGVLSGTGAAVVCSTHAARACGVVCGVCADFMHGTCLCSCWCLCLLSHVKTPHTPTTTTTTHTHTPTSMWSKRSSAHMVTLTATFRLDGCFGALLSVQWSIQLRLP